MEEFQGQNHCGAKSLTLTKKQDLQVFWKIILWTDETKAEHFGMCASRYIWWETNIAVQKKIIPTVQHGGRGMMNRV